MYRIATIALATLVLLTACDDRSSTTPAADPDQAGPATGGAELTSATAAGDESGSATASPTGEQAAGAAAPATAGPATPSTATGDAAAEPPGKTRGTERTTAAYAAWLQSGGRYTAGKAGVVQAVLEAKGDYKCNEKYPYKFKLDPPSGGVSYPESTVKGIQYGKKRSVLSVPFVPSKPGKATISGTFRVSVCNATTCKMGKEKLAVTVTVHDAE